MNLRWARRDWRPRAVDAAVVAVILAVFMFVRRDAVRSFMTLNPDETELLAAGKRAAMSFIPFKDFTVPTYGPAWPMFLGTLHRLGLPLTVPVAHLLSALAGVLCCAWVALGLRRSAGWGWAVIVVAPLVAHWSVGFFSPDFMAMSTEVLPMCFLAAACVVGFASPVVTSRRAITAAVLFGMVVWSKYFFAPLVLVALAALIVLLWRSGVRPVRAVMVVGSASAAPFVAASAVALLAGVPWWKVSETIVFNWNYARAGGLLGQADITASSRFRVAWDVVTHVPAASAMVVLVVAALAVRVARRSIALRSIDTVLFVSALVSTVVAFVLLYELHPIFPHYSYVYFGGCIQAVLLCRIALPRLSPAAMLSSVGRAVATGVAGVSLAAVVLMVPNYSLKHAPDASWTTPWSSLFTTKGGMLAAITPVAPSDPGIDALCPAGSRVLVWGWQPAPYVYYDWQPASRYVVTTYQMDDNVIAADPAVYRPRLAEELMDRPPDCILDVWGITVWNSIGEDAKLSVQMPDLVARLSRRYVVHELFWGGDKPITVYVAQ